MGWQTEELNFFLTEQTPRRAGLQTALHRLPGVTRRICRAGGMETHQPVSSRPRHGSFSEAEPSYMIEDFLNFDFKFHLRRWQHHDTLSTVIRDH